jgi:hypothetical protein
MNSNLLKFILMIFLASFINCQKNSETISDLIIGRWDWVNSISPWTGHASNPQTVGYSITLEFTCDGHLKEYRNDTIDENIGFVSSQAISGCLDADCDKGNWQTITTPIEAFHDVRNIYFYNENIGYIDGITVVYKTIDGGSNWNKTNFPFTNFDTFHYYNENEGFNIETVSVYEGGEFPTFKGSICFKTTDGGVNWSKS